MLSTLKTYEFSCMDDEELHYWFKRLNSEGHPDKELFEKLYAIYRIEKQKSYGSKNYNIARKSLETIMTYLFSNQVFPYDCYRYRRGSWKLFSGKYLYSLSCLRIIKGVEKIKVDKPYAREYIKDATGITDRIQLKTLSKSGNVYDIKNTYEIAKNTWYDMSTNDGWTLPDKSPENEHNLKPVFQLKILNPVASQFLFLDKVVTYYRYFICKKVKVGNKERNETVVYNDRFPFSLEEIPNMQTDFGKKINFKDF